MKSKLLGGAAAIALMMVTAAGARAADVVDEPPVADWSGFYIGGHVGYGWANFDGCFDCTDESSSILDAEELDLEGIVGGVHAGYDRQIDSLVVGAEIDVTFMDLSDDKQEPGGDDEEQHGEVDLLASARLRLGVLVNQDALLYATGGVALPDAEWSADDQGGFSRKFKDVGGVAGGGIEVALSEHIRARAEGLYYFFGESEDVGDVSDGNSGEEIEFEDALVIRGGLSLVLH